MAFTSWSDLRDAIKDAIADHIDGDPCVGEFTHGNRTLKYRSFDELVGLLTKTYQLEALENSATISASTRVSYGRHRRYP